MNTVRGAVALAAVAVAMVVQVTLFSHVAWSGVVPNLSLLVVVGAAMVRGTQFAMLLGFAAGVLLDLAPAADHVAGRWALALVVVGYVAGRMRPEVRPSVGTLVACVAACSFVGTSTFAISGLLLRDTATDVSGLLEVVGVALVWDVLLTPVVLPLVIMALRRLEPGSRAFA